MELKRARYNKTFIGVSKSSWLTMKTEGKHIAGVYCMIPIDFRPPGTGAFLMSVSVRLSYNSVAQTV